jgi:alpha-aminoadipate carrier protein LysW
MTISRAVCPGCSGRVEIGPRIRKGDWVTCPRCGADLEVISLDPPMLNWAYDGPEVAGGARFWVPHKWWTGC